MPFFASLGLDVDGIVCVIPSLEVTFLVFTQVQVSQQKECNCGREVGGSDDCPRDMIAANDELDWQEGRMTSTVGGTVTST